MQYIAIINTPGFMPDGDDEPAVFDTAAEAWEYLREERERAWDEAEQDMPIQDRVILGTAVRGAEPGSVTLTTPGYDGDHDLGLAYSVMVAES